MAFPNFIGVILPPRQIQVTDIASLNLELGRNSPSRANSSTPQTAGDGPAQWFAMLHIKHHHFSLSHNMLPSPKPMSYILDYFYDNSWTSRYHFLYWLEQARLCCNGRQGYNLSDFKQERLVSHSYHHSHHSTSAAYALPL